MKYWNIKDAIQEQVNRESWQEWALREIRERLPKFTKPPKVRLTAGVYNFIRLTLNELRP